MIIMTLIMKLLLDNPRLSKDSAKEGYRCEKFSVKSVLSLIKAITMQARIISSWKITASSIVKIGFRTSGRRPDTINPVRYIPIHQILRYVVELITSRVLEVRSVRCVEIRKRS